MRYSVLEMEATKETGKEMHCQKVCCLESQREKLKRLGTGLVVRNRRQSAKDGNIKICVSENENDPLIRAIDRGATYWLRSRFAALFR